MEWASHEVIAVLAFLLPGFVAAWVFFALTAYPRPSEFERVVQALIFTVLIQGVGAGLRLLTSLLSDSSHDGVMWADDLQMALSLALALTIGLVFSRLANNDSLHAILRRWKFTKQTSFPSEWFGAFSRPPTWVVLHLSGERRLYGWPEEWPSDPAKGHFAIVEAEWLVDEEKRVPLAEVSRILVPVSEVSFVEFMDSSSGSAANA